MSRLVFLLMFFSCAPAHAQNVTISQLPLGVASTTGSSDSFPYVDTGTQVTRRLKVWDIANVPTVVSAYAPKNNPVFTGTVTAPLFVGSVSGTASGNASYIPNQHGVMISGSGAVMSVVPASTANTVFVSGGTGVDPSWSLLTNSNVAANAAVAYSKLNLAGSIVNADIATGAAIAYAKLNLTGDIINGDISSSAAIARSKIASGTINQVVENDGSGNLISAATVSPTLGGTGQNFSAATGVLQVSGGTVSAASVSLTSAISGILPVANGGTGLASGTSGGIPYYSGSGTIASSGALGQHLVLLGGGAGASPITVSSTGTAGQILTSNGNSSDPSWVAPALGNQAVVSVTSTYAILTSDSIVTASSASFTLTLPTAVGVTGKTYTIRHAGTSLSQVYTLATNGQTIGGIASGSYSLYTNGEVLSIYSDNANWQISSHRTITPVVNAGALTVTGSTLDPIKGTVTVDKFLWSREGSRIHFWYLYNQTAQGSGTTGTGDYSLNLPTGLTIDSSLISFNTTVYGQNTGDLQTMTKFGTGNFSSVTSNTVVYAATSSTLKVWAVGTGVWSGTLGAFSNSTFSMGIWGEIPIANWQP